MGIKHVDNKILFQIAVLGMMEEDGMTVHEVLDYSKRTIGDVWHGLRAEQLEEKNAKP
jgi:hypothetical protein